MGKKIRIHKASSAHRILDAPKRTRPKRPSKRHDGRSLEVTTALGMHGEGSDVLFRTFIEQANELILATDVSGKMTFVNPEVSRVTGYTAGELLGRNPVDLVVPEAQNTVAIAAEKVLHGERVGRIEVEIPSKDAGSIFLEVRGRPLNLGGHPVGVLYVARDVTERKQAERKLIESEQKFRGLVEGTAAPVATTDLMGQFSYVNKALADLLGYSTQELSGQRFADFLHPEDVPSVMEIFIQAISSPRGAQDIEFRALRKDGSVRNLRSRPTRLVIDGKTVGFEAIMTDITERRRMEDELRRYSERLENLVAEKTHELRESEERFRGIAERSFDTIFTTDVDGRITYVSPAVKHFLGYTSEEVVGRRIQGYLSESEIPKLRQIFDALRKGQGAGVLATRILRKDGSTAHIEISISPILRDGNVVGIQGIVRDISEQVQFQDALMASESKYRTLVENLPQRVFLKDCNSVYLSCNSRYAADRKISAEAIAGKTDYDFFSTGLADKYVADDKKLIESGETVELDEEYVVDGRNLIVHTVKTPVRDDQSKIVGLLGVFWDITERKRMEEALLRSERLAAIGEMAATIAHDLRNPLTGISGAAFHLKRKLGPVADEKSNEMLELIERDIEYANRIMSELLEYSADLRLELAEVGLRSIVEEALFLARAPSNIRVSDLTSDQPSVEVDAENMKRVFVNLIKNSIEAMPEGGELTIRSTESDGNLQIDVSDTGAGIADEAAGRIWAPFFTTKAKGIGLGLSVCKRIVEAHKGHISFKTEIGRGTTFTLAIPIQARKHD